VPLVRAVLTNGNLVTWFVNSTVVTLVVRVLTVALCVAGAHGFSRPLVVAFMLFQHQIVGGVATTGLRRT
jgi:ABC-type maltose transport system permease subunit